MDTTISRVEDYVRNHITEFHESRITKLKELKLNDILKKKNPYLFKAKYLEKPTKLVENLV